MSTAIMNIVQGFIGFGMIVAFGVAFALFTKYLMKD